MQFFEFLLLNQKVKLSLTHHKYSLFWHRVQFDPFFAICTNKIYINNVFLQLCECKIERIYSSLKGYGNDIGNGSILCFFFNHSKSILLYAQLPHFLSFTTISIFLSLQLIFISSLDSIFSPKTPKLLQSASKNLTALVSAISIPSLFSSSNAQKLHFSLPKDLQQQF